MVKVKPVGQDGQNGPVGQNCYAQELYSRGGQEGSRMGTAQFPGSLRC